MATEESETHPSGGFRSFLRRCVGVVGGPTLAAYADGKAQEFSIERATEEAAAGGLGIVHLTWRAPLWPTAAGNMLHLLAFLGAGLLYGLVVWYAGRELHTYHAMPSAHVRLAIVRSRLVAVSQAALFFFLILSLVVAVLAWAFVAYCWFAGGGHARDARAAAPVAFVAAGILVASYAGIGCLSIVRLPKALRRILRFPFRVASVAAVKQTR